MARKSLSEFNLKAIQLLHCKSTVGEISEGLWVDNHSANPNFRPSFASRS